MTMKNLPMLIFIFLLMIACKKDDVNPDHEIADKKTQRVTNFIYEYMSELYLWCDDMPRINRLYETDPAAYFKKLLSPEDRFSQISNDRESLLNSLDGIEKSFGYDITFGWTDASEKQAFGCINYVYPNSPASKAGLSRGDIIITINGQPITNENAGETLYAAAATIQICKYQNDKLSDPVTRNLVAEVIRENPVHTSKIMDIEGKKTGYLFYTGFIDNFNDSLNNVFSQFKQAGITELILDLRHNPGGDNLAIINLCSHIAPASAGNSQALIISNEHNATWEAYIKKQGNDFSYYFEDSLLNTNLNLQRVFILTSQETASASEVTIVGLKPYMDVVCIGERTVGKYTGMSYFYPEYEADNKRYPDPEIGNWIIFPIISQYKNKNGESSKGGIAPNYEVNSFYLPMVELGDTTDPLVAKAIDIIDGQQSFTVRSSGKYKQLKRMRHPLSEQQIIKNNFIIR